ncbi:MAG: hypothetical protein ACK55I_12315, partial [bacterium]
ARDELKQCIQLEQQKLLSDQLKNLSDKQETQLAQDKLAIVQHAEKLTRLEKSLESLYSSFKLS